MGTDINGLVIAAFVIIVFLVMIFLGVNLGS
jgi:hypothetical protein